MVISVLVGFLLMAPDSFFEIAITVSVLWPFFAVPCVDLRLVSVVFPDHIYSLAFMSSLNQHKKKNKTKQGIICPKNR